VDASGLWPGKVVTEVTPARDFWEAEPEHQGTTSSVIRAATPATSRGRAGSCRSAPKSRQPSSRGGGTVMRPPSFGVKRCPGSGSFRRGVVGLDHEVPQHCSQHNVHLDVGERGPDARRVPPPNGIQAVGALVPTKRSGSKRSGFGKTSSLACTVGDSDHHGVAVRYSPLTEIEVRCGDVAPRKVR